MNILAIIGVIEAALPTVLQLARLLGSALEGDQKAKAAIATAVQSVEKDGERTLTAADDQPQQPARRGPGRPRKVEPAASGQPIDIASVTALCSEKMKELGGKLGGDEAAARQLVKEAVKGAAGVERLKEVPADKLAAVKAAVEALDVPGLGDEDGEAEEF
jgi:hypothetical protein